MGKILKALQKAKTQQKEKHIAENLKPKSNSLRTKPKKILNEKIGVNFNRIENRLNFRDLKNQNDGDSLKIEKKDVKQFSIDSEKLINDDNLAFNKVYAKNDKNKASTLLIDKDKPKCKLDYSRKACSKHLLEKGKFDNHSAEIKQKNYLFTLYRPSSVMAEFFKVIRTILLKMTAKNAMKTILVTSLLPHEGKTFISSNLAVSIALSFDKYVLLIDADLKKPSLQKIFAINPDKGLTDFFMDHTQQLSCLIQKTEIPKLSIIASGSACGNSSELISSETMSHLIDELKDRYNDRYVIFDSAPVQMSDTLSLAGKVDGVLLVAKAGKTSKNHLKLAIDKIGKNKVLGIVLNQYKVDIKNDYYC